MTTIAATTATTKCSQIFKRSVPCELLWNLLEQCAIKESNYYVWNYMAFKKAADLIPDFLEQCKPYYHNSKKKYVDKAQTYTSFLTVLRQICKFHGIEYTSQIKYTHSEYDIVYNIYMK